MILYLTAISHIRLILLVKIWVSIRVPVTTSKILSLVLKRIEIWCTNFDQSIWLQLKLWIEMSLVISLAVLGKFRAYSGSSFI